MAFELSFYCQTVTIDIVHNEVQRDAERIIYDYDLIPKILISVFEQSAIQAITKKDSAERDEQYKHFVDKLFDIHTKDRFPIYTGLCFSYLFSATGGYASTLLHLIHPVEDNDDCIVEDIVVISFIKSAKVFFETWKNKCTDLKYNIPDDILFGEHRCTAILKLWDLIFFGGISKEDYSAREYKDRRQLLFENLTQFMMKNDNIALKHEIIRFIHALFEFFKEFIWTMDLLAEDSWNVVFCEEIFGAEWSDWWANDFGTLICTILTVSVENINWDEFTQKLAPKSNEK